MSSIAKSSEVLYGAKDVVVVFQNWLVTCIKYNDAESFIPTRQFMLMFKKQDQSFWKGITPEEHNERVDRISTLLTNSRIGELSTKKYFEKHGIFTLQVVKDALKSSSEFKEIMNILDYEDTKSLTMFLNATCKTKDGNFRGDDPQVGEKYRVVFEFNSGKIAELVGDKSGSQEVKTFWINHHDFYAMMEKVEGEKGVFTKVKSTLEILQRLRQLKLLGGDLYRSYRRFKEWEKSGKVDQFQEPPEEKERASFALSMLSACFDLEFSEIYNLGISLEGYQEIEVETLNSLNPKRKIKEALRKMMDDGASELEKRNLN